MSAEAGSALGMCGESEQDKRAHNWSSDLPRETVQSRLRENNATKARSPVPREWTTGSDLVREAQAFLSSQTRVGITSGAYRYGGRGRSRGTGWRDRAVGPGGEPPTRGQAGGSDRRLCHISVQQQLKPPRPAHSGARLDRDKGRGEKRMPRTES